MSDFASILKMMLEKRGITPADNSMAGNFGATPPQQPGVGGAPAAPGPGNRFSTMFNPAAQFSPNGGTPGANKGGAGLTTDLLKKIGGGS